MDLVVDVGSMTLAGIGQLLNDIQRHFDKFEKQVKALEIQRGQLEERTMNLKRFVESQSAAPAAKPFRDRESWLTWAFNRMGIGEYAQMEGILVGRTEQRSYTVCIEGKISTFAGQSIDEARGKVRKFLKGIKQPPPPRSQVAMMGVG